VVVVYPYMRRLNREFAKCCSQLIIWLGVVIIMLLMTGCAMDWADGEASALFEPWVEVRGGQMSISSGGLNSDFIVLQRPVAISVQGNDLFLIDMGLRMILRYELLQQTLSPFQSMIPITENMSIFASSDESVYITAPSVGKVMHLTKEGQPLPSLIAPGSLAHPVSVAVDEGMGKVLVADSLYNHIAVFSKAGGLLSIIKPPENVTISSIATGGGGVYVFDRLARRVFVMNWNGGVRYSHLLSSIEDPGSMAVTREGLLFVADNFDNSVKLFSFHGNGVELLGTIGGTDGKVESFGSIGGIAVAEDMLFVSDSVNSLIQSMLINRNHTRVGRTIE